MKMKNYIPTVITASTGTPRLVSLSWTLDSSSCTDLHRDAWRQQEPGCHPPVTQKNSQCSVPWCQFRGCKPAGNEVTSEMISSLDQKEIFQGRSWNAGARVIPMNPSSDKCFLIERKAFLPRPQTLSGVLQSKLLMKNKYHAQARSSLPADQTV